MENLDEIRNNLNSLMWNNFIINDKDYDFLYHYTGLDSAKSIIESGQFWVSEAFVTTDPNEIIHIKEVIKAIIETKYSSIENEIMEICSDSFQQACDMVNKLAFILCFSLDRNSKRLWKKYDKKKDKIRVCLRFNFQNITPSPSSELKSQYRYFVDHYGNDNKIQLQIFNHFVTYDNDIKYKKIEEYMNLIYETINNIPYDNYNEKLYNDEFVLLGDIFTDIFLFSCISKDKDWIDEKEYRMLYLFPDDSEFPSILEKRMHENKEIRYVSTNMKANNTFSLNRIFVSCKKDISKVKKGLKSFIGDDIKIKSI